MLFRLKTESFLLRLALACIGLTVFAGPLAYGAVEPWAYSFLAVLSYTALMAALVRAILKGTLRRAWVPALLPAALGLAWLAAQYVPWPVKLLELVSPRTVSLYALSAAAPSAGTGWLRPSLYPHATRDALLCLSACVALFAATCLCVRSRKALTGMATALLTSGFVVSLIGILQSLSGTRKLYGWRALTQGGSPFGPFVSRNQFATFGGICFFVGLGLLLAQLARASKLPGRESTGRFPQRLLIGFLTAFVGVAVVWSLSRAGLLSMLAALAVVLALLWLTGLWRGRVVPILTVSALLLSVVTYLGWEPVRARLATVPDIWNTPPATRWNLAADAWHMGLTFPMLGTGAGSFLSAYPYFQTLPENAVTDSPHNEYVHILAETGFPGLAIFLAAMGLLYAAALRVIVKGQNSYSRFLMVGIFGAVLMASFHSIVDFPLRSPAIAAVLSVLAALIYCVAAFEVERRGFPVRGDRPGHHRGGAAMRKTGKSNRAGARWREYGKGAAITVIVLLWLVGCVAATAPLRGQLQQRLIARTGKALTPQIRNMTPFIDACESEIRQVAPGDGELYAELSDLARAATFNPDEPLDRLRLVARAIELRAKAAEVEPLNADHHSALVDYYLLFGREDIAQAEAEVACRLRPTDPWLRAMLSLRFAQQEDADLAQHYYEKAVETAKVRGVAESEVSLARARKGAATLKAPRPDAP